MGRRFTNLRSSRPRRPMDWCCGDFDGVVPPGIGEIRCDWLCLPSEMHEFTDPTAMALIMAFAVSTQTAPLDTTSIIGLGVIAWNYTSVNGVPVDTPPVDCPGPLSQCEADWLWWYAQPWVNTGLAQFASSTGAADRWVGSKARRRLGNDRSLLFVAEGVTVTHNVHIHGRALIKE